MLDVLGKMRSKRVKQGTILGLLCYSLFFISYSQIDGDYGRRMLSISQNCTLSPTKEVRPEDSPVFAASFPGSGARVGWQLIQGLTGKPIGDEWDSNGLGKNVIAVKTHWPHPTHGSKIEWSDDIQRAFVLIRNPMYALSEFHNFIYSSTHGNEEHKIAPTEAWMKWRDSNFNKQIFLWRVNVQHWLDNYQPEDRLVTPFERLEDEIDGPAFAEELNQFLGDGNGGGVIDPASVPCIWSKVIHHGGFMNENESGNAVLAQKRKLYHTPERAYTKEQYNQMIVIVRNLRHKYGENERRLDNTFLQYEAVISKARDSMKLNDLYIHR